MAQMAQMAPTVLTAYMFQNISSENGSSKEVSLVVTLQV